MKRVSVELDVPEPQSATADPRRTLLVIVDMENEYCAAGGNRYLGEEADSAVRNVAGLVERARQAGARILWVRSIRSPDALEVTAFGRAPRLLEGTWATEFTRPLAPAAGEKILIKHCHDCFNRTGLDSWLAEEDIRAPEWTVLIAGVALDICVNHAVLGFSVRDYRVVVLLDCVAPRIGPRAAAALSKYGYRAYAYNVNVSESGLLELSTSDNTDLSEAAEVPLA